MEIYPFEVIDYLVSKADNNWNQDQPSHPKGIDYKFLDCRKSKNSESLPYSLEIPVSAASSFERLKAQIYDYCTSEKETHLVLLKTNNSDKEEESFAQSIIHLLRSQNKNFVSICAGGYNVQSEKIISVVINYL